MEKAKTAKDILVGAKKVLETRGWCQNSLINGKGELCLLGALKYSTWGTVASHTYLTPSVETYWKACDIVVDYLTISDKLDKPGVISSFNDAPGRTKDEVLAFLDQVIAKCPND